MKGKCKDDSGVTTRIRYETGRIEAALDMDKAPEPVFGTEQTPSASVYNGRRPAPLNDIDSSVLDGDDEGGVTLPNSSSDKSAIDRCDDWMAKNQTSGEDPSTASTSILAGLDEREPASSENTTEIATSSRSVSDSDEPETSQAKTEEKHHLGSGLADVGKVAAKLPWSKQLFPEAKSTPNVTGWKQPKRQAPPAPRLPPTTADIVRLYDMAVDVKTGVKIETGWDRFKFEINVMGRVKCPFRRCQ